jgi:hypothetical protein
MARGEKTVTLFHPETGTPVEVLAGKGDPKSADYEPGRADVLKERGYLDKKPTLGRGRRAATKGADNSAELEAKDAEIADLKAKLDAVQK